MNFQAIASILGIEGYLGMFDTTTTSNQREKNNLEKISAAALLSKQIFETTIEAIDPTNPLKESTLTIINPKSLLITVKKLNEIALDAYRELQENEKYQGKGPIENLGMFLSDSANKEKLFVKSPNDKDANLHSITSFILEGMAITCQGLAKETPVVENNEHINKKFVESVNRSVEKYWTQL